MTFCENCGAEIKEGTKFCSRCGAKVIENAVAVKTPNLEESERVQNVSTPKANVATPNPVQQDTSTMPKEWYFLKGSEQVGPLSLNYIKQLISCGQVERDTLVWKNGMPDWAKAVNSELSTCFASVVPNIPAKVIPDKWLWGMATLPFVSSLIYIEIITQSETYTQRSTAEGVITFLFIASQSIMGYLDDNEFKKIGMKNPVPWAASILAPVYLFMRADKLNKKSYAPFAVWIFGLLFVWSMIS